MNYYKDKETGEVFAYDDEQVEQGVVKEGLVKMTPVEVKVHQDKNGGVNPLSSDYRERQWRDAELARADIELFKVQDSDPKAVGSVADWRQYRKELRAWPEHEGFPSKANRPKAPDAV